MGAHRSFSAPRYGGLFCCRFRFIFFFFCTAATVPLCSALSLAAPSQGFGWMMEVEDEEDVDSQKPLLYVARFPRCSVAPLSSQSDTVAPPPLPPSISLHIPGRSWTLTLRTFSTKCAA